MIQLSFGEADNNPDTASLRRTQSANPQQTRETLDYDALKPCILHYLSTIFPNLVIIEAISFYIKA